MLASLKLDPEQPDARNLIGVIYVEERETERASVVRRELVHDVPDYQPARENLRLLSNQLEVARGETAAVVLKAIVTTRREVSADAARLEQQARPAKHKP